MKTIDFYDKGFSFINVESVAMKAVKYINDVEVDECLVLNFEHCLLSYDLAQIFDAVVDKLSSLDGVKKIKIRHPYHLAHDSQFLSYLITQSKHNYKKIDDHDYSVKDLSVHLKKNNNIELNIEES